MEKLNEKTSLLEDVESLPPPTEAKSGFLSSSANPPNFETNFASLSLHLDDRIRLLNFPTPMKTQIETAITKAWDRGIQGQRIYADSHEFKLWGNPWSVSSPDGTASYRLVRQVLETLLDSGWVLYLTTHVTRKHMNKDSLIFRQQLPPPQPCDWLCFAFTNYDRIRIIDAPANLRDALVEELKPYIQDSRPYRSKPNVWEVKFHGNPWKADGEATMVTRSILLRMVCVLEQFGFTVYASVDQRTESAEKVTNTDTWHCRRPKDWMPGAPVYHN